MSETLNAYAVDGADAARAALLSAEGAVGLLDRMPGPLQSVWTQWHVLQVIRPALEAGAVAELDLVSVTLTEARHGDAVDLALSFGRTFDEAPAGMLTVLDRRPGSLVGHVHALGLFPERSAAQARWHDLARGSWRGASFKTLSGWSRGAIRGYPLLGNVAKVLDYAFKPLPRGCEPRSLAGDVYAFGAFVEPWKRVLAGDVGCLGEDERRCPKCHGPMGDRAPQARSCSTACRKKANRDRHRKAPPIAG